MSVDELLEIANIISLKMLHQPIDPRQDTLLAKWLRESPDNQRLLNDLIERKHPVDHDKLLRQIDIAAAWKRVHGRVEPISIGHRLVKWYYKYAAIALLAVGMALGLFFMGEGRHAFTSSNDFAQISPGSSKAILHLHNGQSITLGEKDTLIKERGTTIEDKNRELRLSMMDTASIATKSTGPINRLVTPIGGEYTLLLPDGTKVWLNADSELRFPPFFTGSTREVELVGEAFFEVETNKQIPFIVKTARMDICATGTAFNVSAYPDDAQWHATLTEGTIGITLGNADDKLNSHTLKPGMQAVVNNDALLVNVREVNVSKYTAWKNGFFVFVDDPLEQITKKLSRWYGIGFRFSEEELRAVSFTGEVRKFESFASLLDLISLGSDIAFDITNDHNVLVSKK